MIVYTDKGKFEYCKYCDSETVAKGLCQMCIDEGLI